MPPLFTGVGVALVTLFSADGDLQTKATADLAAQLADLGVRALLVNGTTGEAATLTPEERDELVGAVRAAAPADVPVIAGTGAATGRRAAELTECAFGSGADAVLVLSPPGVADPRRYYDRVARSATGPLLAYHFPGASAPGIPVDLLADLPVAGLKDSSGDAARLLHEREVFAGDLWTGAASLLSLSGGIGAAGGWSRRRTSLPRSAPRRSRGTAPPRCASRLSTARPRSTSPPATSAPPPSGSGSRRPPGWAGDVLERPRPGSRPERAKGGENGVLPQCDSRLTCDPLEPTRKSRSAPVSACSTWST